jgi:leucyl/phenylalanyl-tRNA--protein transferase
MHLAARLIAGGYQLFDTQFLTPHLATLGGIEITRDDYQIRLVDAVMARAVFMALSPATHHDGQTILRIIADKHHGNA